MTDLPFTLDAPGRWRLAYDSNQWIVMRRKRIARPSDGASVRKSTWRGTDYIGSEKRILHRCIRERGIVLTPEAQARLDALPERFRDFLVARRDPAPPALPKRAA